MSEARKEINDKIAAAEQNLDATLKMKEKAKKAVAEAETFLRERQETLQSPGQDEGNLRMNIGELRKMREACDATPEVGSDG